LPYKIFFSNHLTLIHIFIWHIKCLKNHTYIHVKRGCYSKMQDMKDIMIIVYYELSLNNKEQAFAFILSILGTLCHLLIWISFLMILWLVLG
jgi:fatty acid desaturase